MGVAADFERWLAEQVSTVVSQVRDEADMNRGPDIVPGRFNSAFTTARSRRLKGPLTCGRREANMNLVGGSDTAVNPSWNLSH